MDTQQQKTSSRVWVLILLAVVAVAAVTAGVWWLSTRSSGESDAILTSGDYQYRLSEDKTSVSIVKYTGEESQVTVPAEIDKKPVTAVEGLAFSWRKQLTAVTIPEGIVSVGNGVFYNCTALTEVTFPASLTDWGVDLFSCCEALQTVTVAADNPVCRSQDGVLFSRDGGTLILYPAARSEDTYVLPDTVTTIGDGAFESCSALTHLTIPETVTAIGERAFNFCDSLAAISLPDGVTSIGAYAFANCDALLEITMPASLTVLPDYIFYNCGALLKVVLPEGLTTIGDCAFRTCLCLTDVTLPFTVTTLGEGVFMECTCLSNLVIPNGVTTLKDYMFGYCLSLETVDIPASVSVISTTAFSSCNEEVVITGDENAAIYTYAAENGLNLRLRGTDTVIHNEKPEED